MNDFAMINEHEEIEMLLPWYITGQLDGDEIAQVDAHMTQCDVCSAMLVQERLLKAGIASTPIDVPQFSAPVIANSHRPSIASRRWHAARNTVSAWTAKPMRVAAFATAQAAMLLMVFQLAQLTARPEAGYRTLSSGKATSQPNAVVMFDAETREAEFRAILTEANATIVGGPTESNAYYLRIDAGLRDSALERLRKQPKIMLAQPVDGE